MTKRKLGSHRIQEVIRTYTCAHTHVQKESEQKEKGKKLNRLREAGPRRKEWDGQRGR